MNDFVTPQIVIEGTSLNGGIAQGVVYFYDPNFFDDSNLNATQRKELFLTAVNSAIESCSEQRISAEENKELILVQKALLKDPSWQTRVFSYIDKGFSITLALEEVLKNLEEVFKSDQFWYARFLEIRGITQLVRQNLSEKDLNFNKETPIVLCSKSISPAEMFQFSKANLVAIVVEDKSFLSHGMIIARSKRIPVVGGITDLKSIIKQNDELLVDGDLGRIYIRPQNSLIYSYEKKAKKTESIKEISVIKNPLQSRDGIPVNLYINASLEEDLEFIDNQIINGVGLYRTEMPFMMHENWPDVETQTNLYKNIFNRSNGKTITLRALDIGRDKVFYSLTKKKQFLQSTSIYDRITILRPALIRLQLRAIIRAHSASNYPDTPLKIMFPMISETQEMHTMISLINKEVEREQKLGNKVAKKFLVGTMVEVPSLVFQLNNILDFVDFISIGSNDLFQFTYAIDRTNSLLSRRYDILSRPFLQLLKTIVDQAKKKGVEISLCGEMASNPIECMALLGIGLRNLSINPNAINKIEKMVKSLDIWSMQDYMNDCLIDHPFVYKPSNTEIRKRIIELAKIQNTEIS